MFTLKQKYNEYKIFTAERENCLRVVINQLNHNLVEFNKNQKKKKKENNPIFSMPLISRYILIRKTLAITTNE